MAETTIRTCDVCLKPIRLLPQRLFVTLEVRDEWGRRSQTDLDGVEVCGEQCAHSLLSKLIDRVRLPRAREPEASGATS